MNFRSTRRGRAEFGIDLMPLIDVVFLLLIFFLITTSFAKPREERHIPVNLPSGVTGKAQSSNEPLTISVTSSGDILVDNEKLQGKDLQAKLESLKKSKPNSTIMLRGDAGADYGRVSETLDTIKAAGFSKVNLVIKKRK